MEKESLKILLERSSTSTENPEISQAISDITDIFNILGGFIPDGLMGNIGSFLSDYRENLSNILHKNGVVTGGAAQVEKPNLGDNIHESIYHSIGNFTGSIANAIWITQFTIWLQQKIIHLQKLLLEMKLKIQN